MKVGIRKTIDDRETQVLQYLREMKSSHDGRYCVRRATDTFAIEVTNGHHHCLVYEPLGMSLLEHVERQEDKTLKMNFVKWVTTYLLTALDYLHTCRVTHTGTRPENHLDIK